MWYMLSRNKKLNLTSVNFKRLPLALEFPIQSLLLLSHSGKEFFSYPLGPPDFSSEWLDWFVSRFLTPKHDKFSLVFCSEELVPVVVPDICFSLLSDVGCCLLCITSQGRGRDSGSVEGHMGAITCDQYHHTGPFLVFCCLRALVWGRRDTFSCGKISVVCSPVACFLISPQEFRRCVFIHKPWHWRCTLKNPVLDTKG